MATFRSCLLAGKIVRQIAARRKINTTAVLGWNKDWKPAPYPLTPAERAVAAKKYGLREEDYAVYDDDGTGYGDYPKLVPVSGDARDPTEDWDIPEMKRNYNEPLHVDHDMYGEDRYNPNLKLNYSYKQMLFTMTLLFGGSYLVYMLCEPYPHFLPVMPKQYPLNNLYLENGGEQGEEPTIKHFTFEIAE